MKRTLTGPHLEYHVMLPENDGGSIGFRTHTSDRQTPDEVAGALYEDFLSALRAGGGDWRLEGRDWAYLTPLFADVISIESRASMIRPILDALLAGRWEARDDLALVNWAVMPLLRSQSNHWSRRLYKERHQVSGMDLDGVVADFEALRIARRPLLRHHMAGETDLNDLGIFVAVHQGLEPVLAYMICMLANGRGEVESEVWAGNPRFCEAEKDLKELGLAKSETFAGRTYLTRSLRLARKLSDREAMPVPHMP
jgi:hypothetical protein